MVTLYLCRHGIAEETPGEGKGDEDRRLTKDGIRKMRKTAAGFAELVGKKGVKAVLTSPLVRARQTAEILADALGNGLEVGITAALAPEGELGALLKAARAARGPKTAGVVGVVAVGHEPTLRRWVSELCTGSPGGDILLKKGAIAAIELADSGPRGQLLWLLQPGMLRELR